MLPYSTLLRCAWQVTADGETAAAGLWPCDQSKPSVQPAERAGGDLGRRASGLYCPRAGVGEGLLRRLDGKERVAIVRHVPFMTVTPVKAGVHEHGGSRGNDGEVVSRGCQIGRAHV